MQLTRIWIGRSFWAGVVLTFVSLLACAITLVLRAVGDRSGAAGVLGVFFVAASAWVLNFVTLVALLAWRTILEAPSNTDQTTSR